MLVYKPIIPPYAARRWEGLFPTIPPYFDYLIYYLFKICKDNILRRSLHSYIIYYTNFGVDYYYIYILINIFYYINSLFN